MPAVEDVLSYPDGQTTDLSMDKSKKSEGGASFLRAARAGNLEKVLEFLDAGTDINTCNANGLNALHLAAKEGHATVIRELLKRGANVDAATKKANTALHIAALAGQEEIVNILVQYKANVNVQSQNGFTPLYMAAQENHDQVVSFLLQNGANQSLTTEDGFTPLAVALQQGHDKVVAILLENDVKGKVRLPAIHIAAKKDDTKAATLLLQSEQNPDVTSKSGFTALHIAAHYGNENIATLLLEKGANVNFAARHNITPLHVAAKWGRVSLVTLLVAHGAVLDSKTRDLLTPLHCAARSGHDQVVDLLIEKGAEITAKTKNGLAPLHMAAQGDHVDCARILLYHKAPVDDVTVDFLTPLHVAAHCGHVRVAKLLLDRGADPNSRALNGFAPLHIACKKNRIKVVELLLKYNANLEAKTESGLTPLHVASFMGCMNIVVFLLQHETSPDVTTVRGETPLHLAARANQTDVVRILLRNNATVDARAREQQTPLHIASRLGNNDIVMLLLQAGADVNAATKDLYTPLHIAAKEGQEDVVTILLDQNADKTLQTKKGFTPIHLAAKYGNLTVVKQLLDKGADVDVLGKNQVTPLHVAAHYDHQNVALLLLERRASPHSAAKNGYTPLHIAAKKNQLDIANTLLEYGANGNSESKAGFTPLHLAAQEGHAEMTYLLIDHGSLVNSRAKNGLTPMHLCAQEDRLEAAKTLKKFNAEVAPQTKAGYTPLHVACHFGQIAMVKFLLENGSDVNAVTKQGYTPLHQAAQQGHAAIIKLLLENNAAPNAVTSQGQTPLAIAQRLGYVSVVETLRTVTETTVITEMSTVTEERYKVQAPETMQETFISDSEDEGEDIAGPDHSFGEDMKGLQDDSLPLDKSLEQDQLETLIQKVAHQQMVAPEPDFRMEGHYLPDNVEISRNAVHTGFLISFMVDARGGAMRGCRHSGVRVIVPPRKAPAPMRITCRYLRKDRVIHPPLLVEGEALASRILEMGPAGAKFLGPVILEVPHFASLRGREREIVILRSDDGEHWKEHQLEATEDAVQDVLNESFDPEELAQLEDLQTTRISRILTNDFPQYFAVVTRIRQEVHAVGPEGGMITSTVVPQVSAVFPEGALTKTIKVSLQAQPVPHDLVTRLFGNNVTVSPIITVEPRRRKFHKPITLTIPVPQIGGSKANLSRPSLPTQETPPNLRLMCSITGGQAPAVWEDITGTTQLNFSNDTVSFTTTVSARFWLVDSHSRECARMAQEIYSEAILTPYMAKFVVFARRTSDLSTGQLRVFCMTDDKEDKTLEKQEHFTEVAKSRDVEVLAGKNQFVEFSGSIIPMTKSGDQLNIAFIPFQENRLPFSVRIKDKDEDNMGGAAACRLAFMREPKYRPETLPPQHPICTLNVILPEYTPQGDMSTSSSQGDLLSLDRKYAQLKGPVVEKIHKADVKLSDVAKAVGDDWQQLAKALNVPVSDVNQIKSEYPNQEALVTLRIWFERAGRKATGTVLERALRQIGREDIVKNCAFNITPVKTETERIIAEQQLSSVNGVHTESEVAKSLAEAAKPTPKPRGLSRESTEGGEEQIVKVTETRQEKQVGDTIVVERTVETRKIITVHSGEVDSENTLLHEVLKELETDGGAPSVVIKETKVTRQSIPFDSHDVLRYDESGLTEGPIVESSTAASHSSADTLRPIADHLEATHTSQELKDSHEWSGSFGSSSEHSGDTIIYRGDSGLVEREDAKGPEPRKSHEHKRPKESEGESTLTRSAEVENLLEAVERDEEGRKVVLTQSQSVREVTAETSTEETITHRSVEDLLLQNEDEDFHPPPSVTLDCNIVKTGEVAHVELFHPVAQSPHKPKSSQPLLTYTTDGLCDYPVQPGILAATPISSVVAEVTPPPRKAKKTSAQETKQPEGEEKETSVATAIISPISDGLCPIPLAQLQPDVTSSLEERQATVEETAIPPVLSAAVVTSTGPLGETKTTRATGLISPIKDGLGPVPMVTTPVEQIQAEHEKKTAEMVAPLHTAPVGIVSAEETVTSARADIISPIKDGLCQMPIGHPFSAEIPAEPETNVAVTVASPVSTEPIAAECVPVGGETTSLSTVTISPIRDGLCSVPLQVVPPQTVSPSTPEPEVKVKELSTQLQQTAALEPVEFPTTPSAESGISVPTVVIRPISDGLGPLPLAPSLTTIVSAVSDAIPEAKVEETAAPVSAELISTADESPIVPPPRKHKSKEVQQGQGELPVVLVSKPLEEEIGQLQCVPSGLCDLESSPKIQPSLAEQIIETKQIATTEAVAPVEAQPILIPPKRHHKKVDVQPAEEEQILIKPTESEKLVEVKLLRSDVAPFGYETDPLLQHNEEYQAKQAAVLTPYEKESIQVSTPSEGPTPEEQVEKPTVVEQIEAFEQLSQPGVSEVKEEPFVQRSETRQYSVEFGKAIPEKEPLDVDVVCLSLGFGLQKLDKESPLKTTVGPESTDILVEHQQPVVEEPFVAIRAESPFAATQLIEIPIESAKIEAPMEEKVITDNTQQQTFVHTTSKQFVAESWSGEHSVVESLVQQTNGVLLPEVAKTTDEEKVVVAQNQPVEGGIALPDGATKDDVQSVAADISSAVVQGLSSGVAIVGGIVAAAEESTTTPTAVGSEEVHVASAAEQEKNTSAGGAEAVTGAEGPTAAASSEQISQFIQQTAKKHFEAITWSGEHQEPEPIHSQETEILVATSTDQTETENISDAHPRRIFVAEPSGRITVEEEVNSEAPSAVAESPQPQSVAETQPHQLEPSHRFEATEWSGEHQDVHLPPAEEREILVATTVGQSESEEVESTGSWDPNQVIAGMSADGRPIVEAVATGPSQPAAELTVGTETHFVRVESHKRFEATEWSGEHPDVPPPEVSETTPAKFQVGAEEPPEPTGTQPTAEPVKEGAEGRHVTVHTQKLTESAQWSGDQSEPPVAHERHLVTESEVYFIPHGEAAQPQLIVQNVTEVGSPVVQGVAAPQPTDAKKEILAPFTAEIPGFSELIKQVTEGGGEANRDVQISYQKHHQKTVRETVYTSGGAEETPSAATAATAPTVTAEPPKVPELSQPSLPAFTPEISQISDLIKQTSTGGGEINISYEKQHQKSVKQTTFSGFQPSAAPQSTPVKAEGPPAPHPVPSAPESTPSEPEATATEASGVSKLLAEMQSFMTGAAAKGGQMQAEFKHHSTRTSRTVTQEGNVGLKSESSGAGAEPTGEDQMSRMFKDFGLTNVGFPTQMSEAFQQHLGGLPAGSSAEMKFQSQRSSRQVTCEGTGATPEEVQKQMDKMTAAQFGVPSKGVETAPSAEPLIRLKVNENVFQGVLDDQQHIHLRKMNEDTPGKQS